MKKSLLVSILIGVLTLLLLAVDTALAAGYPRFYQGVRPMGMGGAFTAVSDDENALFYNPAGLSNISTLNLGILNPMIDISDKGIDLVNDADDTDMNDTGEVADLLRGYVGEHIHLRSSLFPYVGFNAANTGVMIGGILQANLDTEIRNPVWPEAHVDFSADYGVIAGIGGKIPLHDIRLGSALKVINRESLSEIYTATDIADDDFEDRFEDDLTGDTGVSLDVGAIYTLPFIEWLQADIALAVQNIPSMEFGNDLDVETQANAGLALKKSVAGFGFLGALDYMDFTYSIGEDSDWAKRLHMGLEVQFPLIFSLRAGLNQGYGAFGATASIGVLRLDFATYAEEVGSYSGQWSDRRYMGQLTIGW